MTRSNENQDILKKKFENYVSNYSERIYWHIRKIVITHDNANDVVQNTFLKVWKALPGFRSEANPFTWIYRIATNESLDFIRKNKKYQFTELGGIKNAADLMSESQLHVSAESIEYKLNISINQLPQQQKLIFNMRYFDDLKFKEISEILSISEGAAKASFHHAKEKLKKFLVEIKPSSDFKV
ncbi:MAG: RNA polymerase sigma factor [Flavobacteriales bacterium]|nr:RNA polymerase sigma factor [Flavobacteriales bacterium]